MRTSVQPLSDFEIKVEVEVDAADVDNELAQQLRKIGKRSRIKGFRKGKAPRAMLERLYGSQVAAEASRELISSTWQKAIEATGRSPVDEPQIEPGLPQRGKPLTYSIRIQVKPVVELTRWEGMEVSVPPARVADAELEMELGRLRDQHKERVPIEDRGADTGDVLLINATGAVDGQPDDRLSLTEMSVKIGSGSLIPGFEDQLMGARAGEEVSVEVTFPEEYPAQDLAGKEAVFQVEVVQHAIEELPDLDDEFAQDVGHDDLAALRQSIHERLLSQAEANRDREIEDRLIALLLERNKFQAPPAMVSAQLEGNVRRMGMIMQMQGMPQEQISQVLEGGLEEMRANADKAIRRFLALEALADQQEIVVDDQALDAEIMERLQKSGQERGSGYDRDEEREGLRLDMRERATLDLLKSRAKISEAEPEAQASESEESSDEPADPGEGGDEE